MHSQVVAFSKCVAEKKQLHFTKTKILITYPEIIWCVTVSIVFIQTLVIDSVYQSTLLSVIFCLFFICIGFFIGTHSFSEAITAGDLFSILDKLSQLLGTLSLQK